MTIETVELDLETDRMDVGSVGNDSVVRLQNLDPIEAGKIQRTQQAALPAIQRTDSPHPSDPSLQGKVTLGAPEQTAEPMDVDLSDAEKAVSQFPALAWEAIKAGLKKEEQSNAVLDRYVAEAQDHQKAIDLLLQFNAELTALPDKKDNEMTPKMKELVKELKEKGIDLKLQDGAKISKDKAAELKSLNSSFIDQRRSKIQILFTTKIQVVIQNIASIMEALKNIVKDNTRLNSTIVGHSGGR